MHLVMRDPACHMCTKARHRVCAVRCGMSRFGARRYRHASVNKPASTDQTPAPRMQPPYMMTLAASSMGWSMTRTWPVLISHITAGTWPELIRHVMLIRSSLVTLEWILPRELLRVTLHNAGTTSIPGRDPEAFAAPFVSRPPKLLDPLLV